MLTFILVKNKIMADTTFCNPENINDSVEAKQTQEQWGVPHNVFKQEPSGQVSPRSGHPSPHPDGASAGGGYPHTPPRPHTAQEFYATQSVAAHDQKMMATITHEDHSQPPMSPKDARQNLRVGQIQRSQSSISEHGKLNQLQNVEYLGSDDSNSHSRVLSPGAAARLQPPTPKEFRRGAYIDEMQRQNDILKKSGIKLDLNMRSPTREEGRVPPPLYGENFGGPQSRLQQQDRYLAPPPYVQRFNQPTPIQFDYMGFKPPGDQMNQSFTMPPFQSPYVQKNDAFNQSMQGGMYQTMQTNLSRADSTLAGDLLQKEIMRVDPLMSSFNKARLNLNSSLMPFNNVLQEQAAPDLSQTSFSLKDAMYRSMQLAKENLSQPAYISYQPQQPVYAQPQLNQSLSMMNQSMRYQYQQPQPQQQTPQMYMESAHYQQQGVPHMMTQQLTQHVNNTLEHATLEASKRFGNYMVYPPEHREQVQAERAQKRRPPQEYIPSYQSRPTQRIQVEQPRQSAPIRSISVSKDERNRRMKDLQLTLAIANA